MKNRYKIFNLIFFITWIFIFLFVIIKMCVWASKRPFIRADYITLSMNCEQLIVFICWFVFSQIYEKNGRFRKTSLVFYIFWSICCLGIIRLKAIDFSRQFFATATYTPPFIDKFTSLFELCYVCLFSLLFISYFIFLLCKKHFLKNHRNLPVNP